MSDDVKLCAKARKVVVGSGFDISRMRLRATRCVIHLQGTVLRVGEDPKNPDSNVPFLETLDDQLRRLPDLRGIHYVFDNWRREPSGCWRYTGRKVREKKKR
jgi:hypothetical protein